jgi:hypothetical protein
MFAMLKINFMKRFPRQKLRKTPQGMRPGARREAPALPSSLYPDCEERGFPLPTVGSGI